MHHLAQGIQLKSQDEDAALEKIQTAQELAHKYAKAARANGDEVHVPCGNNFLNVYFAEQVCSTSRLGMPRLWVVGFTV